MSLSKYGVVALSALALASIAGFAMAQTQPAAAPAPRVVTQPDWLRQPTAVDLNEYFPAAAEAAATGGRASISCTVGVTGLLKNCIIVNETPRGLGFGVAAVGLASKFQMRPLTVDGVAIEGQITIPINFSCRGCSADAPVGSHITPKNRAATQNKVYLSGVWIQAPDFEQWKASYPQAAAAAGVSGGASFECGIRDDGSLSSCATKNETPARMGFAAAARTLIPYFRADPAFKAPARVIVTIAYPKAQLDKGRATASPGIARALTAPDMKDAFPNIAADQPIPFGRASVQCALTDDGAPTACAVRSETPAGGGFGAAAVIVAPKLRFNMWSSGGEPVIRTITIPLAFGAPPRGQEDLSTLVANAIRFIEAGKLPEARLEAAEIRRRFPASPEAARITSAIGTAAFASTDKQARDLNGSCWDKAKAGKDLVSALKDCNAALERAPGLAAFLDSRALVYLRSGDLPKAIADYDAVLAIEPTFGHAMYGRGLAKLRAGDAAGGEADLKAALVLDPQAENNFTSYGVRR